MSKDEEISNKAAFRRIHDATNTHDADFISKTFDEVFSPDVLIRMSLPVDATGVGAFKEVFARLQQAFPDLHVRVDDLIEEGDKVVSRNIVTGTHQGDFMGIPPTGRSVTYDEIFIFRFVKGRIAEVWGVVDALSLMRQVGLAPA